MILPTPLQICGRVGIYCGGGRYPRRKSRYIYCGGRYPCKNETFFQFMKSWSQHYWTNFVVKHEDKIFWLALSNNCNITEDVVVKHKHKPWDHATLCGKIITPHCALNTL